MKQIIFCLVSLSLLGVVGCSTVKVKPVVEKPVEQTYGRGLYAWSDAGYYISNLSVAEKKIEGCDKPVLVTDLSESAMDSNAEIQVESINIPCEQS